MYDVSLVVQCALYLNVVVHLYIHVNVQIFDYVRDKDGFITSFLNHLGTSAMMDLLLQMVTAPNNDQTRLDLATVCTCTCTCYSTCIYTYMYIHVYIYMYIHTCA